MKSSFWIVFPPGNTPVGTQMREIKCCRLFSRSHLCIPALNYIQFCLNFVFVVSCHSDSTLSSHVISFPPPPRTLAIFDFHTSLAVTRRHVPFHNVCQSAPFPSSHPPVFAPPPPIPMRHWGSMRRCSCLAPGGPRPRLRLRTQGGGVGRPEPVMIGGPRGRTGPPIIPVVN